MFLRGLIFVSTVVTLAIGLAIVCLAVGFQEGREYEAEFSGIQRTVAEAK